MFEPNRSTLAFVGLLVSLTSASIAGCSLDTAGLPDEGIAGTGGVAGAGGSGGAGGTGGTAGAGGAMICEPGTKTTCYTGDLATLNNGICKPGLKTCKADGSEYDVCIGEVLPQPEDCTIPGDEDCDKFADQLDTDCVCPPGEMSQCDTKLPGACAIGLGQCSADGKSFESCMPANASPESCITPEDDDCDGVAAPLCTGTTLGAYTPQGTPMANFNDDAIFSTAVASDGYVIAGVIDGAVVGEAVTVGSIYVAKINLMGAMVWEKKYPCTTFGVARGVAVDPDGNVIVVGEFRGTTKFDMANVTSEANEPDLFILVLDSTGKYVRHKTFSFNNVQSAIGVTVDPDKNIYIVGQGNTDPLNLGGMDLDPTNMDPFIASFDASLNHRWSRMFQNGGNQFPRAITRAANGDIVIVGDTADNDINLGDKMLPKTSGFDGFVARYSGTDGTHVFSRRVGGGAEQFVRDVGMLPNGNVVITGSFDDRIEWATDVFLDKVSGIDIFVAELDGMSGAHVRSIRGATSGDAYPQTISVDAVGNLVVSGYFDGKVAFGGTELTSVDAHDMFVVKLVGPEWINAWNNRYGDQGDQFAWDVAVSNDGRAVVGGAFPTELVVNANDKRSTSGGIDLFAVLVNP